MLPLAKINEKIRQQQKFFILCATVVVVSSMTALVMLNDNATPTKKNDDKPIQALHLGPLPEDQKTRTRALENALARQKVALSTLENQIQLLQKHLQTLENEKKKEEKDVFSSEKNENPFANSPDRTPISLAWSDLEPRESVSPRSNAKVETTNTLTPKLTRLTLRADDAIKTPTTQRIEIPHQTTQPNPTNTTYEYIPAGSFVRATLLSGVYAPTGGESAHQAMPVVLALDEKASLPNTFDAQVTDCRVTGNAVADISSERALIRLERLSCVAPSGETLDQAVKGYVVGPDGKVGVRGRLVTRSGQAISQSILVGLLSGIGKAVSLTSREVYTYGNGTTSRHYSNNLQAGLGEGTGSALRKIADYYLGLANKIFPVLEINGGIAVDLVFSQGITLRPIESH